MQSRPDGVAPRYRRRRPPMRRPVTSEKASVAHGLADAEHVALAVAEPAGTLADRVLARIVALDVGDAVHGAKARHVDLLEHDAALLELAHGGVDVVHLPAHLGERARRGALRLEEREVAAVRRPVEEAAGPLVDRLEAELLRVEAARAFEILRGQPRCYTSLVEHGDSLPVRRSRLFR